MSERSAETAAFELSRIYRDGWNRAKKLLASGKLDVDAPQAAACNPYRGVEERSRWTKGFMEALGPGHSPRRAEIRGASFLSGEGGKPA